jgi:hypothetical protein
MFHYHASQKTNDKLQRGTWNWTPVVEFEITTTILVVHDFQ